MSQSAQRTSLLAQAAAAFTARALAMVSFALVMLAGTLYVPDPFYALGMAASGVTLLLLTGGLFVVNRRRSSRARAATGQASSFAGDDPAPAFVTDSDGVVTYRNEAATGRFGDGQAEQSLVRALGELFADPASVVFRLRSKAEAQGGAQEDVVTRRGHVRITAHRLGGDSFFWRFDEMEDRSHSRGADGLSLPTITVGRNNTILFMNEAARRLVGHRCRNLSEVFETPGPWADGPALVRGPEQSTAVHLIQLDGNNGRREVYLAPADEAAPEGEIDLGLFDLIPVALLKLTPEGDVQLANRLARDLLDSDRRGFDLCDRVEGLGRSVRDWLDDIANGRVANRSEVLRVVRDDQELFVQITLQRVLDAGAFGLVAVLHDATELKALEARFVQSQKMQAIGQLAGGVAHDFNNLLTAISGHCDLLLLRHDQGDPDYGDLMQINQNANRAASLVGQLLAFSRKQTLRPEILDLRDTLTDLTHLLNRLVGEKVELSVSHDPALRAIRADKRQLEQVIVNLVVNARDAMSEGGEVRIETNMHHLAEPLERDRAVVPAGDYVVVRVVDEGQGIPVDKLTKIFEPFYTTKRTGEGTGLGLSTAYGIVKQSGGFIFVDSTVGSGTCFTLFFPAREERPSDDRVPDEISAAPVATDTDELLRSVEAITGAERPAAEEEDQELALTTEVKRAGEGVVLLVEDEAPVRAFASRALRLRGYTVLEAENAEAALDTLRDPSIDVDVFVTDVVMPGMDGPTWVRMALEERPETRVVFVSGYAEETFADTQAGIPNSVFLPKPFSLNDLTTTVKEQMH